MVVLQLGWIEGHESAAGKNEGIQLQTRPILHPRLDFEDLGIVFAQVMLRAAAQSLVPKAIALYGRGSAEEPARQRSGGGDQKVAAGDFHNSILCIEPARPASFLNIPASF